MLSKFINRITHCSHATLDDLDFRSGLGSGAWLLYGLTKALRPSLCVEIGSARGKSTCAIALALKENKYGRLVAIDPHTKTNWNDADSEDTFHILNRNLAVINAHQYVDVRRMTSVEAAENWQSPIELLFIDGDHSYEGVKKDWELFSPFVTKAGIIVFHDTWWDHHRDHQYYRADMGVPKFVDELRLKGYPVVTLPTCYGISLVQKITRGIPLLCISEKTPGQ